MDTHLDVFSYLYKNAQRTIETERSQEARRACQVEKERLDAEHSYKLAQQKAIEERRITHAMASSASILLKLSDVQPQYWMYSEPVHEARGWPRKREVQVGTREQIALEGWPLHIEQSPGRMLNYNYHVFLTSDENINTHPPLVWAESMNIQSKADIKALSATPLSHEDMPWAMPEPRIQRTVSFNGLFERTTAKLYTMHDTIKAETDPMVVAQLKEMTRNQEISIENRRDATIELIKIGNAQADYDLYKKARIERKIQKAIARVAAENHVLSQE